MEIKFWGVRGSIASPGPDTVVFGGNTTCVEVTLSSGRTVVIDAGTGIRALGDHLSKKMEEVDIHLLITHIHWDHMVGFPFFAPLFRESTQIVVDGFAKAMDGLRNVFSRNLIDGTWPVTFDSLQARITNNNDLANGRTDIDDTQIESHMLHHPQGGVGFRFNESTGSFVFLTDNELREDGWKGASFKDFVEFCKDADLLVHDCQYLPGEYEMRQGWGHSDVETTAKLAMEAGVKRLILFHHDPWRKDQDMELMIMRCSEIISKTGGALSVDAAREGAVLRV
jgi:phosphoribosyl 1,2-cyclic phosphodiesterase